MKRLIIGISLFFLLNIIAIAKDMKIVGSQKITPEESKKIVGEETVRNLENVDASEKFITKEIKEKIKSDKEILERVITSKQNELELSNKAENTGNEQKRLYILISSSMPDDVIRRYITATENIRNNTVFVIRGFIAGIKQFKPTFDWVNKILCDNYPAGSPECIEASIDINPLLFDEFNVTNVPTIIYLPEGIDPCNCENENLSDDPSEKPAYISHGDAAINYHLAKMSESPGHYREEIKQFSKKLNKSFHHK